MKATIEQVEKEWAGGRFAAVYFLHGEDDFQIESAVNACIRLALEPESHDFNFDLLYGNEIDGARIIQLATAFPMIAARRVVVVKNIHQLAAAGLDLLAHYCKNALPSTCLVLTAARIDARRGAWQTIIKNSISLDFKPLYDNAIPEWIRRRLKADNLSIGEEAIRMLHGAVGSNLRQINSEIEKIKLNLADRKTVEVGDVERVVGVSRQFTIFELCDAVAAQKMDASLTILRHMLLNGEAPIGILTMLTRHFIILAKLNTLQRRRIPEEQMAQSAKVHPFFVRNYMRQAALYNKPQLQNAFRHLLDADIHLKTSYQKPALVLELLIVRLKYALQETPSGTFARPVGSNNVNG